MYLPIFESAYSNGAFCKPQVLILVIDERRGRIGFSAALRYGS